MGTRSFGLLALALALALAFGVPGTAFAADTSDTPSPAAIGSIGIRLIGEAATGGSDPRASVYIVDHVGPGTVLTRRVEVTNTTTSTQRVAMYPAAARIARGAFIGAADRTPNELSSWTSVLPVALVVPAAGRQTATVTITVPRDAAPGEQYGVVWAEARSTPPVGGGITRVSRVGVRVYLSVGPGGPPAANFTIDSITATRPPHGRPLVLANVHNTGGRALDIAGTLRLVHGPGGLTAGPFPAQLGLTLAIGATEPVVVALDKQLPVGPWDARIILHSGLVERSGRATIKFPNAVTVFPTVDGVGWTYPVMAALAVLLLGLILGLQLQGRRRTRLGLRTRPLGESPSGA